MIDKIKSILKKEEVSAPKELPELLFEQAQVDSSVPNNSAPNEVVQPAPEPTPQPAATPVIEEVAKDVPVTVAPRPKPAVPATEVAVEPSTSMQAAISTKVKVEATNNSMNFIDEDMDLDDDELGEPSVKSQGVYVPPKQVVVSEPTASIKPVAPPAPKTVEVNIKNEVPVQQSPKPDVQINISGDNFFTKVENIINKDSDKLKDLLEQDLFENLRVYHKKKEVGEKLYLHTSEVEDAIKEKLVHLKVIEDEWLIEKQKLEMQEKIFLNKEEELYSNIEELKSLFSKIEMSKKLNEEVADDKAFILVNGAKIHSLAGLSVALRSMSDDVFNYHVNVERNDFASWVSAVFSDDISKLMYSKNDRKDLISVLTEL